MNQRRRIRDVERSKVEILEDELVGGALNGRKSEERFRQEEGGIRGSDVKKRGEEVRPNVALQVGVYEIASVYGAADGGRREVEIGGGFGGGGGGGNGDWRRVEPFLGGERAVEAVGDYDGGIEVGGEAGFDEAAAVV